MNTNPITRRAAEAWLAGRDTPPEFYAYIHESSLVRAAREWLAGRDTQSGFYAAAVHWTLILSFLRCDASCMRVTTLVV